MSQLIQAAERRMDAQCSEQDLISAQEESVDSIRSASPAPRVFAEFSPPRPSLRGLNRDLRSAVIELERLLRYMAPDDVERLLDYAAAAGALRA